MLTLSEKTISDLEFDQIQIQLKGFCTTTDGKLLASQLKPLIIEQELRDRLQQVHEYLGSITSENRIPNHGFDPVDEDIKMLGIEDYALEIESIRRLYLLPTGVNEHIRFFRKFKEYYPTLAQRTADYELDKTIIQTIDAIIDKHGEVKSNASPDLQNIRRELGSIKGKINASFMNAMSHYANMDYLDEIRESVVENRRVLAVRSMYRRKVKGAILGSSKTGTIAYIEPEATVTLSRKLNNLIFEEKEETRRILKQLTRELAPYRELFTEYKQYLATTDLISGCARYAEYTNALLPRLTDDRTLDLKEAYHPLLFVANRAKKQKTYPQSIKLDEGNKIIVISGPNAGGKSITLKTIGLLQVMLQSGLMVPVHERSTMCFFTKILTDIGDNQSIENQLSTYSYRLKNMNKFLRKTDDYTLFLIDEFGTGSDPELGGALAEAMLEELYSRDSYGIITTHYTNLKMLAQNTPNMSNANMLFDTRSLEPMFKLHLGEAGSSFTFEVAQKIGLPYSLINRAKKKVERGKIRFDKTIAALQKERSSLRKTNEKLNSKQEIVSKEADALTSKKDRVQQKLEDFQELYDNNLKFIQLGKKFDQLARKFGKDKRKRDLLNDLYTIVGVENSKRAQKQENKKKKTRQKQVENEALQKVASIRKKKKDTAIKAESEKPKVKLNLGDRVRLLDSKSVGTIDTLEKGNAVVNYGLFTTRVSVEKLELVERKK